MKITIALDVYSGRVNPNWVLEKDEAANFYQLLKNLPESKQPMPATGLGYNGFMVEIDNGSDNENLQVYSHHILAISNGFKVFEDKNHVEQLLIQMAKQKGFGELLTSLGIQ